MLCCLKHVIWTTTVFLHACMLATVAIYIRLMLVLSCLPLHTHAGKEEELLQRQGTAPFFIWALIILRTCMLS